MVLELPKLQLCFFDVRNNSDTLYKEFGLRLAGIHDVQLMELATRAVSQIALAMTPQLFDPDSGGRYEAFNDRPLSQALSAHDVTLLPRLWIAYNAKLTRPWRTKVAQTTVESIESISESQGAEYDPNGPRKARRPWATVIPGFNDNNQSIIVSRPNNRPRTILPYRRTPVLGDP